MTLIAPALSKEQIFSTKALWMKNAYASVLPEKQNLVCVSCPGCGDVCELDKWTVATDGTVTPSVDHSAPIKRISLPDLITCTFHDNIKLEKWQG